jgi:hypothetical protein
MKSLKVIIFRDTDKPYTIIISSSLIVLVTFSIVALVSLLTFSVLGNVMLIGQAETVESNQPAAADIQKPSESAEQVTKDTGPGEGEGSSEETGASAAESEQSAGGEEETPVYFEDYSAPGSPFITQVVSGPAVAGNSLRYTIRVEKTADKLGINAGGKFIAALITSDGRIGPTFPTDVQSNGDEIINPENGILFRISYRRDIGVEFAGVKLEDYTALALFVFETNAPNRMLWRKIESIRD